MPKERNAAVLLVSLRYRQELARMIEALGRPVVPAPPFAGLRDLFEQSRPRLVLIDARGAIDTAVSALNALAPLAQRPPAALAVLVARRDAVMLPRLLDAGATHFLTSGVSQDELAGLLDFAERYVDRLSLRLPPPALPMLAPGHVNLPRWTWKRDDSLIAISPDMAVLLGLPPDTEQLSGRAELERLPGPERVRLDRGIRRLVETGRGGSVRHLLDVGGTSHRLVHHVQLERGAGGDVRTVSAVVEDLDAPRVEQPLPTRFDPTTRLANADHARDWVQALLDSEAGLEPPLVVLLLAISRFDQINAAHGREAAEALLQAVARRLRRQVLASGRDGDEALLARLGGAEFVVAFAAPVTLQEMIVFSQALGRAFERPFIVGNEVVYLACRMGIAAAEPEIATAETLFRRASAALSYAKSQDPNSFRVFTSESGDVLTRMATLETDLRRALEEGELDILYQPQVEIVSGRIVGVEALTRWRHPALGLLSAETLLSVANNAEVTTRLGEHILRKALADAARWQGSLAAIRLSVNVTADDLRSSDFATLVLGSVAASGFPPGRLTLEITESGLIDNLEHGARLMNTLREAGLRIAIDDFGTGYSALAYLKSLPLDYLKVDKNLVRDLGASPRDTILLRGVVDIARSLGLTVVAEGVETQEQLETLVRAGCNWYQGYLCAPPLALATLEPFVFEWNARVATAA